MRNVIAVLQLCRRLARDCEALVTKGHFHEDDQDAGPWRGPIPLILGAPAGRGRQRRRSGARRQRERAAGAIDEFELERERSGQLFQIILRAAF
jgi:hypothetical protein